MKWNKNDNVLIETLDHSKLSIPSTISKGQLFTEVLDIFGKPGRRFYEFLSIASKSEAEKTKLKHLLSTEGAEEFKALIKKEYITYADLFELFPEAVPEMTYLLE